MILEHSCIFAGHLDTCLEIVELFVELIGLTRSLVLICSLCVCLYDVVAEFAYFSYSFDVVDFESVQMSDFDLHHLGLSLYGQCPMLVQVAYSIQSCLKRYSPMSFGQGTVDVVRAISQVIVEVGYFLKNGDTAGKIEQQLIIEFFKFVEIGLQVIEIELLLRNEAFTLRTVLQLNPALSFVYLLDTFGLL